MQALRDLRANRPVLALVVFGVLTIQSASYMTVFDERPWIFPVWVVGLVFAGFVRKHPVVLGLTLISVAVLLRIAASGLGYADQIQVSQSAWERVLAGGNPYGVGYATTTPPGAPFPYGPLALVWWLAGPIVELLAAAGLMGLLLWQRAWLTLAILAGWPPGIAMTMIGVNDYSPALLITLGLILLRTHPAWAGLVLAIAAALKPYAVAWFLPVVGYGGVVVAAPLVALSLLLWSPLLLIWGVPSFLKTVEIAGTVHPIPNALNLPALRWLAIPFAFIGLFVKRWDHAVILGSATFLVFLFLDRWASYGYWLAVLPALGLVLETGPDRGHGLRGWLGRSEGLRMGAG